MGIPAEISGRNDVVVEGRKFSGNAFYQNGGRSYHHGTLLIHVDTEKMGRYLSPSKAKLEAKGVESVRSRVVNLREYRPDLTCRQMGEHLITAFEVVYGLPAETLSPESLDQPAVEALCKRNGSREWLYGSKLPFTFSCEGRFDWGDIQLQLQVDAGLVQPGPGLFRRHGLERRASAGTGTARLFLLAGHPPAPHPYRTEPAGHPGGSVPNAGRTGALTED